MIFSNNLPSVSSQQTDGPVAGGFCGWFTGFGDRMNFG